MRNPFNSWDRSDSYAGEPDGFENCGNCTLGEFFVGENDLALMRKLYVAGHPHRKYLRQIFVSMDITAPLYWWSEFDTYKVGTTANSCSKMHKLLHKPFEMSDFSFDKMHGVSHTCINDIINDKYKYAEKTNIFEEIARPLIDVLNELRDSYIACENTGSKKHIWYSILQLLPESYNQRRTVTMTYENVMNILDYRQGHKLSEWNEYCDILMAELPYVADLRNATQKR